MSKVNKWIFKIKCALLWWEPMYGICVRVRYMHLCKSTIHILVDLFGNYLALICMFRIIWPIWLVNVMALRISLSIDAVSMIFFPFFWPEKKCIIKNLLQLYLKLHLYSKKDYSRGKKIIWTIFIYNDSFAFQCNAVISHTFGNIFRSLLVNVLTKNRKPIWPCNA